MKIIARVLVFVLSFQGFGVSSVMAQTNTVAPTASQARVEDPAWPDRFSEDEQGGKDCIASLESGQYRIYQPTNLKGTRRNPLDNKTDGSAHFRVELPRVGCALMKIEDGNFHHVPQAENTVMRAHRLNGIVVIDARDDCGNEVKRVIYPQLKLTVGPPGPIGPQGIQGPMGPQGPKGDKGDPGLTPLPPEKEKNKSHLAWWLLAGAGVVGAGAAYAYSNCLFCKCPPGYYKP